MHYHNSQSHRHLRGYPRLIARFSRLDGGKIGELTFTAKTPGKLEMELGNDFVLFNRDQAAELISSLQHFLALSRGSEESDSDDSMLEG